jgi:membrane-bound lytic murein transglycosylase MltF
MMADLSRPKGKPLAQSRSGNIPQVTCATLLAGLALLAAGCSSGTPGKVEQTKGAEAPANGAGATADDVLPPILRQPWKGDLDKIAERRVLRVVVPFRRPEFFFHEGRPVGILQEAFQELERVLNAKYKTTAANRILVAPLPTPMDQVRDRMAGGFADIAAFGISITEQNKAIADFTIPTMKGLKIIVVTGPGAPELKTVEDLSGKEVWIHPHTRLQDDINGLNARLKVKGKAPVRVREADPMLEPGDLLEMVNAGMFPITLTQNMQAEFWAKVLDKLKPRTDLVVSEAVELGWAIQKGTPKLKAFLDEFLGKYGVGSAFGNTLIRRYMESAAYVKNATEENEMKKFRKTEPHFRKYSKEYDLDPLMLVALGYQESRLDQGVKSPVGAVGIMQVMPRTAASSPVKVNNIHDEENNIHAGVRLIHFLIEDYFKEPQLDNMNRTLFAIASYNAGPAKIQRCRELAKSMSLDPNRWFGNVEVAVAKVVGRETTQYVGNIYKYYIGYRLARDAAARRRQTAS